MSRPVSLQATSEPGGLRAFGTVSERFGRAWDLMKVAKRIAILGFGYHPVNMRRLRLPVSDGKVWGTCYGFTGAEREFLMNSKYTGLKLLSTGATVLDLLRNQFEFQPD
jgi:hypothetical protein